MKTKNSMLEAILCLAVLMVFFALMSDDFRLWRKKK